MNYKNIFIIGAPRSGTNMLRDVLSKHVKIATWNCDEINDVWHQGRRFAHDELHIDKISRKHALGIKKFFNDFSSNNEDKIILEKTCANTLRVGFLAELFPEAFFIYIYRNGQDTISSAHKRWLGSTSWVYLWQKLAVLPFKLAIPVVTWRIFRLVKIRFGITRKVWGPRYQGMDVDMREQSLESIVKKQWVACTEKSLQSLSVTGDRNFIIKYEEFTRNGHEALKILLERLGVEFDELIIEYMLSDVRENKSAICRVGNDITVDKLNDAIDKLNTTYEGIRY